MKLSYDKLWNLMKANKMKKGELAKAAGVSQYMMTRLNRNESVDVSVIVNICKVFHCNIEDVVEVTEE